ncbi:hypothetical protein ACFQO1_12465 [Jejudonia soesokkakensis]|uniref:Lipocalin-like domain-containing protein n=1 Tax=Jejudonia soesokkakensis TaxID=1323432 RepID=A0ABW2N0Q8_9FLAO
MKKFVLSFLVIVSCIFIGNAQAECSEEFKQIQGFWETLTIENAINDPEALSAGFNSLKDNLSTSLGKLSFDKSLPKFLPNTGKLKKGTLKKGKKRSYVTYLSSKDTMEVIVASELQLTGLSVMICTHNREKMAENAFEYTFTDEDTTSEHGFYLTGIKGKVISVALKNNGEKLPYTLAFRAPQIQDTNTTFDEEEYEEEIETDDGEY